MPSVATTPRRMEALARALDRAAAGAVVPRPRIDQLRSAFVATDSHGRSWTIDPEFQRWGRLDGERWMVDDPPAQLFMDSELRTSLEALEAMAARAIMTGADRLHAPSTPWFQRPVAPAEPPATRASMPSPEPATGPASPLAREDPPVTQPARASEPMSPRASAPRETLTARPATEDPVAEPAPMASVMPSEVSAQGATPVETPAPSRPAIPEAHLRFAGPGIAAVPDTAPPAPPAKIASETTPAPDRMLASAESPGPGWPRDASHDRERWVPTLVMSHLTAGRSEAHDDRAHLLLCGVLAMLFLALGFWKADGRGYAAALLFGLVAVALLALNLAQSRRHD